MNVMQRRLSLIAAAFVGLAASATAGGCSDDTVVFPGGDGGSGANVEVERQTDPAPGGVRRLTARQYINSVRLIFGDAAADAAVPPEDLRSNGFSTIGAADLAIPITAVEQYDVSAEAVGRAFATDDAGLSLRWTCNPGETERSCFESFVQNAGRLAWRRPLQNSEVTEIVDIAVDAVDAYETFAGEPFVEGVQYAISALLTAPEFLYIIELGDGDAEDPAKRPLTQVELATRMSFFFTDTTPDAVLLDMAAAGELETDEQIREAARQLVAQPAARTALRAFFDEVYGVERIATASKNEEIYPQWNREAADALREGTLRFIDDVVWGGDMRALHDADFVYVNEVTAPFYGLTATGTELQRMTLPAGAPRKGLMGQAGMLAMLGLAERGSPTKRGVFIQAAFQCASIPPPPPDVVPELPEVDPDDPKTMKEQLLEVHMNKDSCAGCHALFDPAGLAFEQFDGVGMFRERDENDLLIDPSGEQSGIGAFADAAELSDLLAADEDTPNCLVTYLFRNSMGHLETEGEEAAMLALQEAFAASDFRVEDLLVEVAVSPAFKLVGEPK